VVVLDRSKGLGEEVAEAIGGVFVAADVADEEQVAAAVAQATELGPLRILVNCAGIGHPGRTLDREGQPRPLAKFELLIRVNLVGTFNCLRLAASAMSKTEPLPSGERGSILNTASIAAFEGQVGQAAYSASKAGIVGMTLPVARDLGTFGIRVNTIAPGAFDTPIYGGGDKAESLKTHLREGFLFPDRFGRADEFASMAVEVLTNSYMNGEVVRLDGGSRLPAR
jgi:NAD(P)-dependent dehydrogenase (short-subunit alcohol dehydrogenase family)